MVFVGTSPIPGPKSKGLIAINISNIILYPPLFLIFYCLSNINTVHINLNLFSMFHEIM